MQFVENEELSAVSSPSTLSTRSTGEVIYEAGDELTEELLAKLEEIGVKRSRCWRSITSTSAPTCATRWPATRTPTAKKR